MRRIPVTVALLCTLLLAGCSSSESPSIDLPSDYPNVPVVEEGLTDATDAGDYYVLTYKSVNREEFQKLEVELVDAGYTPAELPDLPPDAVNGNSDAVVLAYENETRYAVLVFIPNDIFGNGLMNYENRVKA